MPVSTVVIVGGGLAGILTALRLRALSTPPDIVVVEAGEVGGNHTWCFHAGDLSDAQRRRIAPLIAHSWAAYDVRFPDWRRLVSLPYCCITADRLRDVASGEPGFAIRRAAAARLEADRVTLEGGETLAADLVIDARGARPESWRVAWQGFLGRELRLAAPHGLKRPILMDATVSQGGAYRFVYCLPFSPTELLVEDTRYQDDTALDIEAVGREIDRYVERAGWRVEKVLREETGMLPIVLSGDAPVPEGAAIPVGMRAGLFHPVTGYSLPDAVRLADVIAEAVARGDDRTAIRHAVLARIDRSWRAHAFGRMLNRLLFLAGKPDQRWRIMSRFYRLSEPLIARFYAGRTHAADMLRILVGKPPVPIVGALASLLPASADRVATAGKRA